MQFHSEFKHRQTPEHEAARGGEMQDASLAELAFEMEFDEDVAPWAPSRECVLHSTWTEREAREAHASAHWHCEIDEEDMAAPTVSAASTRAPSSPATPLAKAPAARTLSDGSGPPTATSFECVVHALFAFELAATAQEGAMEKTECREPQNMVMGPEIVAPW